MPHPADIDWMVRRGWDFNTLMAMGAGEFNHWLQTAIEAAEREKSAMEAASKG